MDENPGSDWDEPPGILEIDLVLDGFGQVECFEEGPEVLPVIISREKQAVGVSGEELARVFRVAFEGVEGGAGGEISAEVGMAIEQAVQSAVGFYGAGWIGGRLGAGVAADFTPEAGGMADEGGVRAGVQCAFEVVDGPAVPEALVGHFALLAGQVWNVQMQDDRAIEPAGDMEQFKATGVVEQHAKFPFAADAHAVYAAGGFEQFGGRGERGVGTISQDEAVGVAVAGLNQVAQGDAGVGAIGAGVDGVQDAVVADVVFVGEDIPGKQPGEGNLVVIHVGDQSGVILAVPENVLVCVDDHMDGGSSHSGRAMARGGLESGGRQHTIPKDSYWECDEHEPSPQPSPGVPERGRKGGKGARGTLEQVMLKLSAFADEISPNLDEQIRVCVANGVEAFELRGVNNLNVLDFDAALRREIRTKLAGNGLAVACIGSPIGKVKINEPFGPHFERFKIAVELAEFFEAPFVRIFSYYPADRNDDILKHRDEVLRRMRAKVEYVGDRPVVLVHENEADIFGEKVAQCVDLMKSVDSPRLRSAFDFANFVLAGESPLENWAKLKPYTVHIHIKDARKSDRKNVPAGQGDGQIEPILADLYKSGYRGYLSMEPHLAQAGQFKGHTGPELFKTAVDALRAVAKKAGVRV